MSKRERLEKLSTPGGIIAALAIDQRKSLRRMIADAAGVKTEEVSDGQVAEFKGGVTRVLTKHASAVLLDPEYGLDAARRRAPGCGLLLAYESDGYENPRPHKMLALMPRESVRRLKDRGADGIKILLTYTPHDDPSANDEKQALVERIGNECAAQGLPFFLEPVGYDPGGLDPKSFEYAQGKAGIVLRSMEEFSKPEYGVDVLKVEFPVNAAFVEGTAVYTGRRVWTREEAVAVFREADRLAGRVPYIYLSAGVSALQFRESLGLATEAGARFSGVLCGRATWQEGVPVYARQGVEAFERWLENDGVRTIQQVNECLRTATAWHARA
ncbi:MAG: tagatose 1,6-diphosphate aldolase [Bryobacteraceae bacterium]|nr:tagatose 1,6-diphosphate aldolase [Bryobacteraceae bacterium]